MNQTSIANSVLLCMLLSTSTAFAQPQQAPAVKDAALGSTRNVHLCGSVFLAGQPTRKDIDAIKAKGIKRVITLRTDGEVDWDESGAIKDAGLDFVKIPFRDSSTLTDEVFDKVRKLLQDADKTPTMLHCGSANRVGAVWLVHRVLDQGVPLDTAVKEAKTIGLRNSAYEEKAKAYISTREKSTRANSKRKNEQSVRPGINKSFLDPKLDVNEWIARFQGESREIYKSRREILDALQLKPGTRAADIGAGTGFFTTAMAAKVGESGWVYAVDISPRFIEHIGALAAKAGLANVTPLLCAENSVRLPADSIDLAFICDTYHHFEYPKSTLASIHRALRPGGTLVVIDFERIPGKSREFVINHVRADKETFRTEIEAAGFGLAEEVKISGLSENYCLRFRKR